MRPRTTSSHAVTPSSGIRKRIAPSSSYALPSATSCVGDAAAVVHPVELEGERAVPVEPEPAERVLDLVDRLRHLAARVGVLDPEAELAALMPREEPVEEERAHAADVEETGRAGSHADDHGHADSVGSGADRRAHLLRGRDRQGDRPRGRARRRLGAGLHPEPAHVAADEPRPGELRALPREAGGGRDRRRRLPCALPLQPRRAGRHRLREVGRRDAQHDGGCLRDRRGRRRLPRRLASRQRASRPGSSASCPRWSRCSSSAPTRPGC